MTAFRVDGSNKVAVSRAVSSRNVEGTVRTDSKDRRDQNEWVWLAIIALAFISVSLTLYGLPESAIQYWYLYFAPLVLAALRYGLRGALIGSVASLVSILLFYRFAVDTTLPSLKIVEQLVTTATSPSELQSLAFRMADLRARDPYTNFVRALTGGILLVGSSILLGVLT
ncbi:MAG: hypothetical protein NTZ05_00535, partial [Chloroflexi bacterium]|nr:hypothetical protein [Chloroflexota bacterium]